MRILIAEDDPKLLKSLIHIFRNNRYITDGVSNGADAFNYAATGEYDGIVMDIMMPEKDGLMVLRELREQNITTPVLLLTARTEIPQRIEGLDTGADDYLPKPFAAAELMARVRAMLRRKSNYTPDILSVGSSTGRWTCFPTGYQKTEEVFRNIQPENRRIWEDLPQDS